MRSDLLLLLKREHFKTPPPSYSVNCPLALDNAKIFLHLLDLPLFAHHLYKRIPLLRFLMIMSRQSSFPQHWLIQVDGI